MTTVEALADMTPEQLEAIEGIGPKTVEKISLAVNNYFSSLEAGAAEGEVAAEGVAAEGEAATRRSCAGSGRGSYVKAKSPRKKLKRRRLRRRRKPKPPRAKHEEHEPKDGSAPETTE